MIKIAIPHGELFDCLLANVDEMSKNREIIVLQDTEEKVADLFARNLAQLALLTPYDLIRLHRKGDFRIIPGPSLSLSGRTGHLNIHLRKNAMAIKNCLLMFKSPYLEKVVKVLYAERYNVELDVTIGKPKDKDFTDYDLIVDNNKGGDCPIDFTEDWFDTFDSMLPLAFWVGRHHELPANVVELSNKLADSSLSDMEETKDCDSDLTLHPGIVYHRWTDEQKEAIEKINDLLFYSGDVSEIADIKLMDTEDN